MTPTRAPRHDREHIVTVALDLLDRLGLPDLTMRRLATELAVQPSALYWHFSSKQDLLAAVAERILSRIDDSPSTGLDDAARRIRDALLAYRDGAEVVMSSAALRPGASRAQELLRATMDGDTPTAVAVLHFVLGHTLIVQQRMHAESHGAAAPPTPGAPPDEEVFAAGLLLLSRGSATRSAGRG